MFERLILEVGLGKLSRRGFLEGLIASGVAVATVDVDALLWKPGQTSTFQVPGGLWLRKGDLFMLNSEGGRNIYVSAKDLASRWQRVEINYGQSLLSWDEGVTRETVRQFADRLTMRANSSDIVRYTDVTIPMRPTQAMRDAWAREHLRKDLKAEEPFHAKPKE